MVVGTTLVTYYGTYLVLLQLYYSGNPYWKFEGSLCGLELGINEGNKLVLRYGIVLGTTLGALGGLTIGTYDGLDLVSPQLSIW